MKRLPIGGAKADELMLAYARAHATRVRDVDDLARGAGIVTSEGRLVYAGARWYLLPGQPDTRRFRVALPTRGARTVEVATRARLAVNLLELGYSEVMAGRLAYRAWKGGLAATSSGRVVAQEVRP